MKHTILGKNKEISTVDHTQVGRALPKMDPKIGNTWLDQDLHYTPAPSLVAVVEAIEMTRRGNPHQNSEAGRSSPLA